jgi:predicted RNase H-like nuclease
VWGKEPVAGNPDGPPFVPAIADVFGLSREMSCKTKARAASRIPTIESLSLDVAVLRVLMNGTFARCHDQTRISQSHEVGE